MNWKTSKNTRTEHHILKMKTSLSGAGRNLQYGARGGVQKCHHQHPPGKHLELKVILANIRFPQLVPQQECRQVPKEVCQTVFLNPRNVKVSLAFGMEGFASQCRPVPSPGHATNWQSVTEGNRPL